MGRRGTAKPAEGTPPRVDAAVGRFMLGSLAAIAAIVVGGYFALSNVALDEAEIDTRDRVRSAARLVEASGLADGALVDEKNATQKLDDLVHAQIIGGPIVRVKIWTQDGTIVYSDEPALIGLRFSLGAQELALFRTGGAQAEVSDLGDPENRFERQQGKLLEAHTTIRAPDGTQLLFEIYERYSSVTASSRRLLTAMAPPLIGGLAVLMLFQLPLAWSMGRRLQRGHREREALLTNAVEASAQERRRIAADLHDGVVQDLAGVAFGLAPLTADAQARGDAAQATALRQATDTLRQGVRSLRTLLVEIHPPNLESAGLRVALSDLLSPLAAAGIAISLDVDESPGQGAEHDELVYRVAREALRNAQRHASASAVSVAVRRGPHGATALVVSDDGAGFSPEQRAERGTEGHLGLTLLEAIVQQAGGTLTVHSAPGTGTMVEMELPAR